MYIITFFLFSTLMSFAQNKISEVCYDIYAEPYEVVEVDPDYYAILHKTSKNCEKYAYNIYTSEHEYMFDISAESGEEKAPTLMYARGPKNFRMYDYYAEEGNLRHILWHSYNLDGNLRHKVKMYFSIIEVLEKPLEEIQIIHLDFESYIIDKAGNFYVSFFEGSFAGIGSAVLRVYNGSEDLSNWNKFQFFDYKYSGQGSFSTSKIHGFSNASAYRFERFDYYEDGTYGLVNTFPPIDNVVQFGNKHYFLSSGNMIYYLNDKTDILDSLEVIFYYDDIIQEKVSDGIFYRLSRDSGAGNKNKYILQGFDPILMEMTEEYQFESDLEGTLLFNKDGDKLLLYGNIGEQTTMEEFLLNMPPSSSDFGIDLAADLLEVINYECPNGIREGLNEMSIELSIELSNLSSATIHEVDLIYFLEDSCDTKVITPVFTLIASGEMVIVPFTIETELNAEIIGEDFIFDLPCVIAVGKNTEHEMEWSNNSTCTTFTVPLSTVGQGRLENRVDISIFPNPGTNEILFGLKGDVIQRLEMTDVSGKLIKSIALEGISDYNWNANDISAGIYFIKVYTTSGKESVQKWVKL